MFSIFRKPPSIGIDLGTANTLMYLSGQGVVLDQPSVVAINKKNGELLKAGEAAKHMIGKTPDNIETVRPVRDGVIANKAATDLMMQSFMKSSDTHNANAPRMVIGVPSCITDIERLAVREAGILASREVHLIDETVAAAIGAGLPINEPTGSMIVDIGGGTTDVAVLSLGAPVTSESVRVAGDKITESIASFLKQKYSLIIGEKTSEDLKLTIGSAHKSCSGEISQIEVCGLNHQTGLPQSITVTSTEVCEAIQEPLRFINDAIKKVLDNVPPELAADVYTNGIVLAGGGALIPGISELITESTGLRTMVANDPLHCVVNGCGEVVENWEEYKHCVSQHDV